MKSEEIAKIAGVSRSTVSRVVNKYSNVPDETREKVMKVIEAYNYRPNSFARTLAGKRSNTIGLFFIVDSGRYQEERIFENDYFTLYLNLLVDFASEKDYFVLVSIISQEIEYAKISQAFFEKRIDGGIIIGTKQDTLKKIQAENINSSIILFDYELTEDEKINYKDANITMINSKDEQAIEKAVDHLVQLGHKDIGFIRGIEYTRSGKARNNAFQKAMHKSGLAIHEEYCFDGHFSVNEAYKNMKKKITEGCLATAYISANDFMAIGVMDALKEANISVPDAISIIGFDKSHRANEIKPRLTTMAPDFHEMSKKAIEILHSKINGNDENAAVVEFPVTFYEKESCSKFIL
ncbi:MAG: LacI family DNA-binding transcriptional regulator [Vallitaleaceae bacterium]|nr:LacI family DNA-binding transcriptional regulator [Vallitaleaceae bacterium]